MASNNAVSTSAKGATTLIILQITSRAITFALNQILLRFLSPELLGASVQLELYKLSVQYFSRESLRVAAERRSDGGIQAAVNLSYLAILANVPLGFILAQGYRGTELMDVTLFPEALRVNQFAAFLELLMEPAFTTVQQNMLYGARAAAEGSSVVLKTITVFGLYFWAHSQGRDLGVLPFAIGEIVNSITLTAVYWSRTLPLAREKKFSLFPKPITSSPTIQYLFSLFSLPLLNLIASLFFQTGIKYLLTEGDKYLILYLASLEENGTYALAANYGGLVARMIFQPIEISSRNLFANLCAPPSEKEPKPSPSPLPTAAQILTLVLKSYTLLTTLLLPFGPLLAPLCLTLLAGPRWSTTAAPHVLRTYTYYIPLLALNGVTEAFVAATASTKDLRVQSLWMAAFSVLYAASAGVFVKVLGWGAEGLVWAGCVNMGLRVLFNWWYISSFFAERGVKVGVGEVLPRGVTVGSVVGVMSLPVWVLRGDVLGRGGGVLGEVVRTGVVAGGFLGVVLVLERRFLRACWGRFR